MTENQWLRLKQPNSLWWRAAEKQHSPRKLRLFGCACCRRLAQWLTDERSRSAIDVNERFADGLADCP